jgi:hypothetical protein
MLGFLVGQLGLVLGLGLVAGSVVIVLITALLETLLISVNRGVWRSKMRLLRIPDLANPRL